MKYNCCYNIMNTLVFAQSDLMACCCSANHKFIKYYSMNEQNTFRYEEYKKVRDYYISLFKKNMIPEGCVGCAFLEEKDWNEKIEYKNIIISNRTKCSCNCIYCSLLENDDSYSKKKELNTRKTYEIKPILANLKKYDCIANGANIQIAGGEPTEYPDRELDWLIDFAVLNNYSLEILSSGINYSKKIEQTLKKGNIKLVISPDSGSKIIYEKIKRVKKFGKVWKNIKKYCISAQKNNEAVVCIKYIIVPQINDSISEISTFIEKCKESHCKNIVFSLDFNWFEKNKDIKIDFQLKNVINYIFLCIEKLENNISISFEPQLKQWFYAQKGD